MSTRKLTQKKSVNNTPVTKKKKISSTKKASTNDTARKDGYFGGSHDDYKEPPFNSHIVQSIILRVVNKSNKENSVLLFDQAEEENKLVEITPMFMNYSYKLILKNIAVSNMKVTGIYLQVINGDADFVKRKFNFISLSKLGSCYFNRPIEPFYDEKQLQKSITYTELPKDEKWLLNINTKLQFMLPPATEVMITVFVDSITSPETYAAELEERIIKSILGKKAIK